MIILGNFFSNIYLVEPIVNFLKLFAMNFDEYDGIREGSKLMPKIYFHFTLFLPSALTYFLYEKNYLKTILLSIAIILSISRGAIITSAIILFIYLFSFESLKGLIQKSIFLYIASIILIETINLFVPDVRVGKEETGRQALKKWADATFRDQFTGTSHHIGNHIIDFDSNDSAI